MMGRPLVVVRPDLLREQVAIILVGGGFGQLVRVVRVHGEFLS
jgi:hypothetical protein